MRAFSPIETLCGVLLGLLIGLTLAVNSADAATAGPVAAYSFDEGAGTTLGDVSGGGHTGTIRNAAWSTGHSGGGLSFNGTSAWVTIPDAPALDMTQALTVEAWVQPRALGGWNTVVMKEQPAELGYAVYANSSRNVPAGIAYTNGEKTAWGRSGLTLGRWTYLAATYDGSVVALYVDGALASTSLASGPVVTSTGALRIGGNSVWGEYFNGLIDDVRVYDRALGAAEVQRDMTTPVTAVPAPDTQAPSTPSGLATSVSGPSATVSWNASTDNVGVAGYGVYLDAGAPVSTAATSTTLTGLACGTSHTVAVDAVDAAGNRSAKSQVVFTMGACSGSPATVFVSRSGSDANTCTQTAPCAGFDRAYHVAAPGAVVEVAGGTYPGQIITADPSKNTASSVVTFRPAAGAAVTVNGELRFSSARHLEIQSMTAGDYYVGVNTPAGAGQTQDITLRNMTVHAFYARSVDGLRIIGGDVGSITGGCGTGCTPFAGTVATAGSGEPIIGAVYCGGGGCSASTAQSSNVLIDGVRFHDTYRVRSSGVHSSCLWVSSVTGLTIRNSTFHKCDSQTIHMTYETSFVSSPNGSVSKNVLIENNFMEPPTDNGGTQNGFTTLTLRYDNVQGNCLRNWVLRNNTIPGSVALSSDLAATGCGANIVMIGNIIGAFKDSTGRNCAAGTLSTPIVFRYNVFLSTTCDATDRSLAGGSFGLVDQAGGNYHLVAGSPALNVVPASAYGTPATFATAGGSSPTAPPAADYDGEARPRGTAYDAGADEAG